MSYGPVSHGENDALEITRGEDEVPGTSHHDIDASNSTHSISDAQYSIHEVKPTAWKPNAKFKLEAKIPPLRYRRRTIYLLIIYLPLLLFPWIVTCVLNKRPLNTSSYIRQAGGLLPNEYLTIAGWFAFVRILNSITGVITIPIISTILAQAAVIYVQRRNAKQALTVRQTFALADRGWSDIMILWGSWGSKDKQKGTSSRFLWGAFFFITICAIQQPIQQALVVTEYKLVMTCLDDPIRGCSATGFPIVAGYDPEPGDMALVPQNNIVQEVAGKIVFANEYEIHPRMWPDVPPGFDKSDSIDSITNPPARESFFWNLDWSLNTHGDRVFFASALANGTTTGVLREHAMRLNSSVDCTHIAREDFPSVCPGNRPFTANYSRPDLIDIRVCAPGEYGVYPWTLSRNRQDITEELFIDAYSPGFALDVDAVTNFTLHCTAGTTRGYFELGNYRNNFTYGPLLEKWPTINESYTDFNDYLNWYADYLPPSWNDSTPSYDRGDDLYIDFGHEMDPFNTYTLFTPGPLMTSAVSIFGNTSFFFTASNSSNATFPPAKMQLCQRNDIPFTRLSLIMFENFQSFCNDIDSNYSERTQNDDQDVARLLMNWIYGFNETESAKLALSASMFFANQAVLTQTQSATAFSNYARKIFTAPGEIIPKPAMTVAGVIIVSVLIFIQLLGLAFTVWYIYRVPSWSHALDAITVARMGASLGKGKIGNLGPVYERQLNEMRKLEGLVGVVTEEEKQQVRRDHGDVEATERDSTLERDDLEKENLMENAEKKGKEKRWRKVELDIGAKGLIGKELAPSKVKKAKRRKGKRQGAEDV